MSEKDVFQIVSAVIERDGRYLLTQRKETAILPLLWEFPGGKVEPGEAPADALEREVAHRVGVDIVVGELIGENTHSYAGYEVHQLLFACTVTSDRDPFAKNVAEISWAKSSEFDKYEFPPADQRTMDRLLGRTN